MLCWTDFNTLQKENNPWMNRPQRKNAYKAYTMKMNSLDNCVPTPCPEPCDECFNLDPYPHGMKQQKESAMYGAQAVTLNIPSQETYDPLKYILYRLESIRDIKIDELREEFGMDGMNPKTIKELKQWLKDGYYYIDDARGYKEDEECWALGFFHWGEKPDTDGFKDAREKLNEAYYSTVDLVKIKTDEDTRLKALQDFQSSTFH